jgi:murein DD-endopeptidase MepM/ murein hydrolase activator NlpD
MVGWCTIMTVVSGFLVAEYRFFKSKAQQLEQLKGDYAQHLAILKKRVHGHVKEVSTEQKEEEVKPSIAQQLLVVNRALKYVQASALSSNQGKIAPLVKQQSSSKKTGGQKKIAQSKRMSSKRRIAKNKKPALMKNKWMKVKREAIFACPLDRSHFWLSSPYGPRKNPDGTWGFHSGIDMAAQRGTPVKAAGAGRVIEATYSPGYGNTIVIEHDRKFKTRYAHLDKMYVRVGQEIKQGQYIGKVGATGFVRKSRRGGDGSHLHFEVYVFGKHTNPFYFLA